MSVTNLGRAFITNTHTTTKMNLLRVKRIPAIITQRNLNVCMSVFGSDSQSLVPQKPVVRTTSTGRPNLPPKTVVDLRLVRHLEKLSLVDFGNREGIAVLEAAISQADQLSVIDTEGVEPMISVLENRCVPLSEDKVNEETLSDEVLACSHTLVDEYFVVPPGNITHTQEKEYHTNLNLT
ncbi:hypothetical protein Pmani_017820 [Petrolisthes manimaculis]|uniref:Glutamyl-tRNA(Gln) amidotransferase subunit C, mitochondrial n=1 Tax=Petrolisthes manimaculis TaxID=1843537 RepID=A0AAE1PLM8_9EUCA|nr:hypothetical protein Pmani_017820 [Petrolisthes manimaculis]